MARFGTFNQELRLPAGVDRDAITADYTNGVLRVVVSKRREPVRAAVPNPSLARRVVPSGYPAYPAASRSRAPRNFRDDSDFWW